MLSFKCSFQIIHLFVVTFVSLYYSLLFPHCAHNAYNPSNPPILLMKNIF